MNLKERLYYSSSPSIQNALVSLAGRMQYSKRYKNLNIHLKRIEEINALSLSEKEAYQSKELQRMVKFCGTTIPFYQKLFSEHGINFTQITSKQDLKKIPVLSKRTIIENIDSLIRPGTKRYITQKTSGTTGTPFTIHMNDLTYELAMALLVEHEQKHGVAFGARRATFAGRLIKNYNDNTPPFFRLNMSENQAIFSTYHFSKFTLDDYDKELSKFAPEEMIGYSSAIYNLAILYSESNRKPGFQPKVVVTNSETLFSWQRSAIESVFGCTVYDYYGTAEYILFASQEKDLTYTLNPILGIHEIVDPNGNETLSGSLIGTSLTNTIMPLLRYEIGDIADGIDDFSIRGVTGRVDDQILTPDGRRIGRTGEIFGHLGGIKEAQIIQHELDYCEILIVKNNENAIVPESEITAKLQRKFGKGMRFEIRFIDEIQKSNNGKFKAVKSLLKEVKK